MLTPSVISPVLVYDNSLSSAGAWILARRKHEDAIENGSAGWMTATSSELDYGWVRSARVAKQGRNVSDGRSGLNTKVYQAIQNTRQLSERGEHRLYSMVRASELQALCS